MRELSEKDVELILIDQKKYYDLQVTRNLDYRVHQLIRLKKGIKKYEKQILHALYQDLGKHVNESYMTEIGYCYHSIDYTIRHLKRWARPKKKLSPFYLLPSIGYISYEPYGSVLIIGPYNYPFQLLIEPLIGSIAAGNTAVLKPSELTPHVSRVIKRMIEENFDREYIACVEGGVDTNTSLLNNAFDYIFFTGSVPVGKIIMKAAAKRLIPITLELGGKSPVIVDDTADIRQAARRIMWGKTVNAGQTCVAPDYVLVQESVKEQLMKELKRAVVSFYGKDPMSSESFGRIVNQRHFQRIKAILDADQQSIVYGGQTDEKTRYIAPTIIDLGTDDAASMQEEIFGPLLPVLTYQNLDDAIRYVQKHPKPLALYLFTRDRAVENRVLSRTSSGGACVNDTIMHLVNPAMPFGGVGNSGIGAYHGRDSFLTFSHRRSVLKKPARLGNSFMYPKYTKNQLRLVKLIMH